MESYGTLLKTARENKGFSIEEVERETTITRQFIEAMETENAAAFPGEAYMVGFLKNYSEYLGVDSSDVLKLYHAKKIQESPIPTELLAHNKPKFLIPIIVSVLVFILIGVGIYLYLGVFKVPQVREENARIIAENNKVHTYEFDSLSQTRRLYKGDIILVPDGEKEGENIVLTVNDTLGVLNIQTPAGNQILSLSEERELDVNGDGSAEVIVYLSDISNTDANRGAEVRMLLKNVSVSAVKSQEIPIESSATISNVQNVILEDNRAYPFTIQVSFRGDCLFRYKVDRQDKIENYYSSGEQITATASNATRVWMSNGNALSISVLANSVTYPLEVGKAGQVRVQDIKWIRDSDGKYRLVVVELD